MNRNQALATMTNGTNGTPEALVEAAFNQVKQLVAAQGTPQLFPNGIGSLAFEIGLRAETRPEIRISVNISGPQLGAPAAPSEVTITMDGDVEVTFNAEGHHIIALIMEQDLTHQFPQTMKKVNKILKNGGRTLLAAATFPDDIRATHPETKPFHFVDIPFQAGGPVNPPLPHTPHVISKIADFSVALKQVNATAQQRVDALSWLIHLFGDIHQPLHCIERISELHPGGDRGGNSFQLKGQAHNLHSLWDSSVSFTNNESPQLALDIMQEHSRPDLAADLAHTEVESWARASFALARKFAYGPLQENPANPPTPSAAYLKKAEKIGRKQAALAAYRLSNRLHEILG